MTNVGRLLAGDERGAVLVQVAIAILVLGFNFVGDGLRDRADPKMAR